MCLPVLHITLGIFYRLFTLLEDECHKLDLAMAAQTTPLTNDRDSYTAYSNLVHQERSLLDQKTAIEGEIQWLDQMVSYLTLNSTNPSNDPTLQATLKIAGEKKKKKSDLVCFFLNVPTLLTLVLGETTDSLGKEQERCSKEGWTLCQKLGRSFGLLQRSSPGVLQWYIYW